MGISLADVSSAQHPVDVQKASANGEHFKALATYLLIPSRRMNVETRVAAARSAWALGLHRQAADELDIVLREKTIDPDERARLTFMRGVIDYQEEQYQEAALYSEKTISLLKTPSPLRARAYLLWGQAFMRMKSYGAAEERFKRALPEADSTDVPEIHYALGEVQIRLGKLLEAEEHMKAIPMDNDRTPFAVRNLASIALETEQNERAKFWLQKGRSEFPEAFLDSWAEYGLLKVALADGDLLTARQLVEGAVKQYAPSDPWLLLMQATIEKSEWERRAQLGARQ